MGLMAGNELVTSTSNPKIKRIRKLRDRKDREQVGLFYIEGMRIVGEAIESGAGLDALIVAPELLTAEYGQGLVRQAQTQHLPIIEVSAEVFHSFAVKEGPQGIAALVRQRWERLDDVSIEKNWVALDSVADPGNLGTILRTNDAVGGAGVILLDHSTDPYDVTAVRASMGAIFAQRLVRATFSEFTRWKQQRGVFVVGTSDAAQQDYQHVRYPRPAVLLMGSEREGLSPTHMQHCDLMVAIPMVGRSDSLNLAVATGIVLYEMFNQGRSV